MTRWLLGGCLVVLLTSSACGTRNDRPWFTRRQPDVEEGIAALRAGNAAEALAAFDRAAARYPSAPEVALDRGLALLAAGSFGPAREAFVRALGEGASRDLRAEALYDMGLAHHREADAAPADGAEPDRERMIQSLRDAVEAYRRSLRTKPGQRDVAWNLEIALRRQHEEEEQQRQEQQQQQEQQDQQQQDQQQANQDPQDQQGQPQQPQDQQGQPQDQQGQPQDQQQANQDPQQGQDSQSPTPDTSGSPSPTPTSPGEQEARAAAEPRPGEERPAEARPASAQPDAADSLSPEMRAMLDALDRGEGSLEEERARARAARENRRPTQDW